MHHATKAKIKRELDALKIPSHDWCREKFELVEVERAPMTFSTADYPGAIACVSAENGDDMADYYGEYRGGYPWINPALESFAESHGCYWEWLNPGSIALYEA